MQTHSRDTSVLSCFLKVVGVAFMNVMITMIVIEKVMVITVMLLLVLVVGGDEEDEFDGHDGDDR